VWDNDLMGLIYYIIALIQQINLILSQPVFDLSNKQNPDTNAYRFILHISDSLVKQRM
jgi:hypothetical protein